MRRVWDTGFSRADQRALGLLISADALGASGGVDTVGSADSLIGATRPAISAVPGHSHTSIDDDFVSHAP